eukprot:m.513637 g.513637  ORF g.513637 m.513637 type:complete len:399 (+) comp57446_c0_seq2:484-1680(+)
MPPKRNERAASRQDSTNSEADTEHSEEHDQQDSKSSTSGERFKLEATLTSALTNMGSSSSATRVKGLNELATALAQVVDEEYLSQRITTLIEAVFKRCFAASAERVISCRILGLLCLQVGEAFAGSLHDVISRLRTVFLDDTLDADSRAACVDALALIVFLVGNEAEHQYSLLQDVNEVLGRAEAYGLTARVIRAWMLLLTRARTAVVRQHKRACSLFRFLLENSTNGVVLGACGEAVALVHELDGLPDTDAAPLQEIISLLAFENNHHKTKVDIKEQHQVFRAVCKALESDEFDGDTITFNHDLEEIEISSWAESVQIEAMKGFLLGGFDIHLSANMHMRAVFELGPPAMPNTNPKKLAASKASRAKEIASRTKARDQHRAQRRDQKSVHAAGGEDD